MSRPKTESSLKLEGPVETILRGKKQQTKAQEIQARYLENEVTVMDWWELKLPVI
jgi:hypothetical protein